MATTFSGVSANDIWTCSAELLLNDNQSKVKSRVGEANEILHAVLSLSNPRERWVTNRVPYMSIAYSLAEIVWIMVGSNDSTVINFWNPLLPKYAGTSNTYHGAYGFRIMHNFGFDQLEKAYHSLKNNPTNRQTVIQIWDPSIDFPTNDGQPVNSDIPCNICSLLKIRDNKLEWAQIMRSNDIFRGLPYNLVQFTSMQEILAGWLGVEVGSYTHYSDSLHLYSADKEKLSIDKKKHPSNNDNLSIPIEDFSIIINKIYTRMKILSTTNITKSNLLEVSNLDTNYSSYQNILIILATYAAKKFGFLDIINELLNKCTNELYIYMWNKWNNNTKKERKNG